MRRSRSIPLTLATALAVGAVVGVTSTPASAAPSAPVVVVSGLNNPRQITLVTGGAGTQLLVAEAGKGGSIPAGDSPEGPQFAGLTGSVSAVSNPATTVNASPKRVVTGLLSSAGPDGSFAVGSDGVAARYSGGKIYSLITYAPPDVLPKPLDNAQSGKLLVSQPGHKFFTLQDVSGFEKANDPDGHGFDSNPYGVLARKDDILVADAAGNSIIRYGSQGYGAASVFHAFPNFTAPGCPPEDPPGFPGCNFVPTSLAQDAAGNVYVGALGSLVPGAGRVVKLDPTGKHVLKTWTGFTSVDGVAVGKDGSLYVAQLFATPSTPGAPGVLTKVGPDGTRTSVNVPFATGVAVDDSNNVYVAAFGTFSEAGTGAPGPDSSGQIWKLRF